MAITINGSANTVAGLAVGGLPDGTTDADALASNAVTNVKVADDAIGVAELSATGTASSSTFLRGDNSWAAVTAPTGWEKVFRSTGLSGDQDIETASLFDGTYNQIMIYIERGVPSADDTDIGVRFKIDGSGYVSAADYKYYGSQGKSSSSTLATLQSDGTNEILCMTGCGNAAGEWYSGQLNIRNFSNATDFKLLTWEFVCCRQGNDLANSYGGGGLRSLTNSLDGVRLMGVSGGNLGSTIISGYGLKL